MRRFLLAVFILLALYFGLSRFTEIQHVVATLQRGQIFWIGLALVVQCAWLVNTALTYRAVYQLLGIPAELSQLLPLVLASNFMNVLAPTGGATGIALLAADARRRGLSPARVTIAGVLYVLVDYFAFIVVLALGLSVLVRRNHLGGAEIGASIILLLTALVLAGLLALGARSASALDRVLTTAARFINSLLRPILRRDYLSEERAHSFAAESAEGLSALRAKWYDYALPVARALFGKALMIAILFLTFLAFQQSFSVGTLIASYSIAFLFTIVSPTPMGLGVVEGVMTLALRSLSVPLEAATVITLAYRGFTFWLPFGYGFITLQFLQRRWNK